MTYQTKGDLERKDEGQSVPPAIASKLDEIGRAVETLRQKNDASITEVKKGFDDVVRREELTRIDTAVTTLKSDINAALAEFKRPAGGGEEEKRRAPEAVEHKKAFDNWFRTGDGERELKGIEAKAVEAKAIAAVSNNDPAGGFTVTPEMDNAIDEVVKDVSPFRQVARVVKISTNAYQKLVNQHGANSGWVGETGSRPQTLAADLAQIDIPTMELYAMPAASQTLLDDSRINIEQWLADEVSLEFAQQENRQFISGDGVAKPRGILGYTAASEAAGTPASWGSIGYVPTGVSGDFAASNKADQIIDLMFRLKMPYRANSTFLMSRLTMNAVRKIKDGQGNYLADLRLRDNMLVETIFGRPVLEAEDMPAIAANSYSIAFGDFSRGYTIVDRVGSRVLRDPYSNKPYVLFYTTRRVGGGVTLFEAIKLLKFGTS
jgi:HK97 family phage major capsid protein